MNMMLDILIVNEKKIEQEGRGVRPSLRVPPPSATFKKEEKKAREPKRVIIIEL
jgi:hypothetical protein